MNYSWSGIIFLSWTVIKMHSVKPKATTKHYKKQQQVIIANKPIVEIKCNTKKKKRGKEKEKEKLKTLKPKRNKRKKKDNRWDKKKTNSKIID